MAKIDFLVSQEIFMTETAKLADVILPATCFAEKDGTFANTERRIQRVRKAVDAPGQARPDWQIISQVATAMGYPMSYNDPGEIYDEMAALSPNFAGINYERIDKVGHPVALPHQGAPGHPLPACRPLYPGAWALPGHPPHPACRGAGCGNTP